MKFKIDENLPVEAAELLRRSRYDTATVSEQGLSGYVDSDIASACQREGRILVTLDTDFADLRAYPPNQSPGFVVLRLQRQDKLHVLDILMRLAGMFLEESLEHHLWIVEEKRVRIRS